MRTLKKHVPTAHSVSANNRLEAARQQVFRELIEPLRYESSAGKGLGSSFVSSFVSLLEAAGDWRLGLQAVVQWDDGYRISFPAEMTRAGRLRRRKMLVILYTIMIAEGTGDCWRINVKQSFVPRRKVPGFPVDNPVPGAFLRWLSQRVKEEAGKAKMMISAGVRYAEYDAMKRGEKVAESAPF